MTSIVRRAAVAGVLIGAFLMVPIAQAVCPGDCDGNGSVTVNELVIGVNIALDAISVTACPAFDTDDNHMVSVNELVAAVAAALNGCPVESPTVTLSPSPTPTLAIAPIFPADYSDSFKEVRNCRLGIEHGGIMIRVLANPIGYQPYLNNDGPLPLPLPQGSIIVKEEFSLNDTDCDPANLVRWSAMRKEAPGFDSSAGDWHWQRVTAPSRTVTCDTKDCPGFVCITCHSMPVCLARDYMCTANTTPRGTLQPVLQNLPAAVLSVSGTAPNDVYAVGADSKDGRGPYVIHYNGSTWKRLDTDVTSGGLWWISVTPIDGDFYMAGDNGVILQFDPSSGKFTRQATPDTSQLYGIWGTAANNLWAVGGTTQNQPACAIIQSQAAVVWHYDGHTWTSWDVSGVVPPCEPSTILYKVWGRSATDVYAVGDDGIILHFDGMNWSLLNSGVTNQLFTVNGTDSVLAAVGGSFLTGVILEQQSGGSFVKHAPSGTPQMNGVFVPASGNAVAVGVGFAVATRDSSGWTLVNDGTSDTQARDFHGTWIDASDGIWAVGGDLSNLNNGILSYGGTQSVATGPVQ